MEVLNSCFSSIFEKRLKVVSITNHVVDEIEQLPSVTAEEGTQHLLENLYLKIIRKLAKIFEGPW